MVYDYTPSRSRHGPESFLGSYQGYLQADDFAGYEALYRTGRIKEVACWAHARRKFHDAKVTDLSRARTALAMIGELYAIERELGDAPDDERKRQRELRARPVLDRIEAWLLAERRHVLPKTQIAKAINYALNLWPALVRYLEDGTLAIDNNTAENGVRPVALGRKNWLFAGSDEGARRAAVLASLVETCKRHAIDAFSYLRDIFQTLPTFRGNLADLMPSAWKARQTPAD